MSEESDYETTIHTQGVKLPAPELDTIIDMEAERLKYLLEETDEDEDLTRSPPVSSPDMFPGLLGEIVNQCCANSEAVPVAVAINVLLRFAALVGPMVHLPIGDERRLLNEFILMVGPTGLGKGGSNHGPSRLFKRVEECLELDLQHQFNSGTGDGISDYPHLKIHTGGLSSGEGLAAALDDGDDKDESSKPVTDKRILVFEPEFSNLMSMSQRTGNILSMVLRNAFDGVDIKPMTKRDKVRVTDPYLCLFANITASELTTHDQSKSMALNGMLNRFLILWQQPVRGVAFPEAIPDPVIDRQADALADCLLFARQKRHITHYKEIKKIDQPITLSDEARIFWERHYHQLLNRPDCELVTILTRRHRLHALILSSLFALLDHRFIISASDIHTALAWCEYSRQSVVYIFSSLVAQRKAENCKRLSETVLRAISETLDKKPECTATDLYQWFSCKIRREQLSAALEYLMNHIPPLVCQEHRVKGRGRPTQLYWLTGNNA